MRHFRGQTDPLTQCGAWLAGVTRRFTLRCAAKVVSARAAIALVVNDPCTTFDIDAVLDLEWAQACIDNLLKNMRSPAGLHALAIAVFLPLPLHFWVGSVVVAHAARQHFLENKTLFSARPYRHVGISVNPNANSFS